MSEEKSAPRKDTLIEQVLQCQIVIARNIGLDRDVSGEYYGLEKKRMVLSGSIGWHVL